MNASEVTRAPLLVGVQLVRATVLVAVLLGLGAFEEGVTGLEAHLLVPSLLGGVVVTQESKL